jgi:hypothetical protein
MINSDCEGGVLLALLETWFIFSTTGASFSQWLCRAHSSSRP